MWRALSSSFQCCGANSPKALAWTASSPHAPGTSTSTQPCTDEPVANIGSSRAADAEEHVSLGAIGQHSLRQETAQNHRARFIVEPLQAVRGDGAVRVEQRGQKRM